MSRRGTIWPRGRKLRGALRDDSGASMVEFAIVVALFLLVFLGLVDFGRLGYSYVMAEKAMQRAARIAAVRPPVCSAVPEIHQRDPAFSGGTPPEFGTSCSAGANVCVNPGTYTCTGDAATTAAATATANEVWAAIYGLMPADATLANVRFSYGYDPDLGFLGGPYVPVVTAEVDGLDFRFTSPLGSLAILAGAKASGSLCEANGTNCGVPYPPISVSLPGEDLALGESG